MYDALGAIETSVDLSDGLRLAVVPVIDIFIDRDPAAAVDESQLQAPPVPPDHDQDVGEPLPLSKEPLGATLLAVAGSSRYTNPDFRELDAYSVPFS